jgi:hypothetical protein
LDISVENQELEPAEVAHTERNWRQRQLAEVGPTDFTKRFPLGASVYFASGHRRAEA